MVGEGWKLIPFNIAMHRLLNVEVLAHGAFFITANKIIIIRVFQ